jgi:hypothetical protein
MEKFPTPTPEISKASELAVESAKHFEANAFVLLSKIPESMRTDVADALADFSEQFNTFENTGHQLSTPEAADKARQLAEKLRSFKI